MGLSRRFVWFFSFSSPLPRVRIVMVRLSEHRAAQHRRLVAGPPPPPRPPRPPPGKLPRPARKPGPPPPSIPRPQIGNLPGAVRKTDALPARIPPSPETLKSDCTKIGHKSDARHQDNFPHSSPILAKQNLISPNQAKIKLLKIKDWTFICEEKVTDYKSDALPTELRQRQNSPS